MNDKETFPEETKHGRLYESGPNTMKLVGAKKRKCTVKYKTISHTKEFGFHEALGQELQVSGTVNTYEHVGPNNSDWRQAGSLALAEIPLVQKDTSSKKDESFCSEQDVRKPSAEVEPATLQFPQFVTVGSEEAESVTVKVEVDDSYDFDNQKLEKPDCCDDLSISKREEETDDSVKANCSSKAISSADSLSNLESSKEYGVERKSQTHFSAEKDSCNSAGDNNDKPTILTTTTTTTTTTTGVHDIKYVDMLITKDETGKLACLVCGKTFKYKSDLKRHILSHSSVRKYKCEFCGKHFKQEVHLKGHRATHTGNGKYACDACGANFVTKFNYRAHISTCTSRELNFHCDECGKKFGLAEALEKHQKFHSGEMSHKCEVCGKEFLSNADLKRHKRVHTDEKPFVCIKCGASFRQSSHLYTHLRRHGGMEYKEFKCSICDKSFIDSSNFRRHELTHNKLISYVCEICGKSFVSSASMRAHRKVHTKSFKTETSASTTVTSHK